MSLIYVTGAPGTGKSTIEKELRARGFETHDIDDPDLGWPLNIKTGKRTRVPPIDERSISWFSEHKWHISRTGLEKIKNSSNIKTIFVCGTAKSENEVLDLFDKIVYLQVDEDTLKARIKNRIDNDFGGNTQELNLILKIRGALEKKYTAMEDVVIIDAKSSISSVVDKVLSSI